MVEISWSHLDGLTCIRLQGVAGASAVAVRPALAGAFSALPPMAGSVVSEVGALSFVPRFAPLSGSTYVVFVDGEEMGRLLYEGPAGAAESSEVLAIHPTAEVVPRNLLRFSVTFSAPMGGASVRDHIGLLDDGGEPLADAILPLEYDLWDAARIRLTVLMDPARIKRGLVSHRALGYPLRPGARFRFVVGAGLRDAHGRPLLAGASRVYQVGDDERRRVDPGAWELTLPAAGTVDALEVAFGRPLDHALLGRCLSVVDGSLIRLPGTTRIEPGERSWTFEPRRPWTRDIHRIVVDPVLEDLAGNSVQRVFDRDLSDEADAPVEGSPVPSVAFEPR